MKSSVSSYINAIHNLSSNNLNRCNDDMESYYDNDEENDYESIDGDNNADIIYANDDVNMDLYEELENVKRRSSDGPVCFFNNCKICKNVANNQCKHLHADIDNASLDDDNIQNNRVTLTSFTKVPFANISLSLLDKNIATFTDKNITGNGKEFNDNNNNRTSENREIKNIKRCTLPTFIITSPDDNGNFSKSLLSGDGSKDTTTNNNKSNKNSIGINDSDNISTSFLNGNNKDTNNNNNGSNTNSIGINDRDDSLLNGGNKDNNNIGRVLSTSLSNSTANGVGINDASLQLLNDTTNASNSMDGVVDDDVLWPLLHGSNKEIHNSTDNGLPMELLLDDQDQELFV